MKSHRYDHDRCKCLIHNMLPNTIITTQQANIKLHRSYYTPPHRTIVAIGNVVDRFRAIVYLRSQPPKTLRSREHSGRNFLARKEQEKKTPTVTTRFSPGNVFPGKRAHRSTVPSADRQSIGKCELGTTSSRLSC